MPKAPRPRKTARSKQPAADVSPPARRGKAAPGSASGNTKRNWKGGKGKPASGAAAERSSGAKRAGRRPPTVPTTKPHKARRGLLERLVPIILRRIAGGEILVAILAEPEMPHRADFYAFVFDDAHPERYDAYVRAREAQAHTWADEIVTIADDASRDSRFDHERGEFVMDGEWVQRSKIRVDARKWLMARVHRRAYGDHLDVTSDGKPTGGVVVLPALGS